MNTTKRAGMALLSLALAGTLAACGSGGESQDGAAGGDVTIDYWLWDDKQQPSYQACADAFHAANPNITVKITQTAWAQYWQNLTTQLAAGQAPDVWTDHVSYYPQFVSSGQILDIQPYVTRDKVDLSQYQEGLADVWVKDGKRFGLPKDWDTIALVYNSTMLAEQGIKAEEMANLTWNPTDGGTLQQVIAKLTVDEDGRNGLDPKFDKNRVKVYGFLPEWADGSQGQNGWGDLAVANGWTYLDKNPWGTRYKYDDPKLAQTIDWYKQLIDKGYAPKFDKQSTLGRDAVLNAGKGAMTFAGSWTINTFLGPDAEQKFALAPMPLGPAGVRKTAINGLSDAIFAGTEHKEEAWKWVKFLASADCQNIVAGNAVVFPAIKSASDKAAAAHKAKGRDVQAYLDPTKTPGGTFLLPITDHGNEVSQIVQDAIQSVVLGQIGAAEALKKANDQVNALFT
ncbi:multiple sugar transport system substrate-binding protein [Thermocatellispora tengchongensis]|uniref:Multiple sugar transport system substrate-binding protein n=1 Tax=Thermocatellispora tengchongensis TaxID=1073253 RepID=A0A840PL69_9ACTN|nr:sugar ABC transporter substrate-binding protein [Thermocatellispora tengchongensis]MBB5137807.1 multiple sugar transport system substrate-binding protein [Thermocatellispora tengchongensis]